MEFFRKDVKLIQRKLIAMTTPSFLLIVITTKIAIKLINRKQ
jgi:hypothetical protein